MAGCAGRSGSAVASTGESVTAATRPTTQATSAITSRTTPRWSAKSVESPTMAITIQSSAVIARGAPVARVRAESTRCGDDAAVTFALQTVARRDGILVRRVRPDAHAPQRSLAGLERFGVGRIARTLQLARKRIRALVVREGGELHRP